MSATIQWIHSPATDAGDARDLAPQGSVRALKERAVQLEAESAGLRRKVLELERTLARTEILLANARIREMELRDQVAELSGV